MRFLTRSLTGLAILALSLGLLVVAAAQIGAAISSRAERGGGPRAPSEQVFSARLMTLTPQEVAPVLSVTGMVRARRELQLRAGASGRLVWVSPDFHEGAPLEEGAELARIDPAPALAARDNARAALDEARGALDEARLNVTLAADDLAAAETQAKLRRDAAARQTELERRDLGTSVQREAVDLALSGAEQAVLARRKAQANAASAVTRAELAVERAEITLREAERALADTTLRAGFSGVATSVSAVEGKLVTMNEQLGLLIDPEALEVEIPLSLDQFLRLEAGAGLAGRAVEIALEGSAGRITAPAELDRAAASVAQGAAGRLVYARILSDQTPLQPGDFVSVSIPEPVLQNAARIPAAALGADNSVLIVGEGERLASRAVDLLRREGDDVIVSVPEALSGAKIVAERTPQLGSGIKIRDAAQAVPDSKRPDTPPQGADTPDQASDADKDAS